MSKIVFALLDKPRKAAFAVDKIRGKTRAVLQKC